MTTPAPDSITAGPATVALSTDRPGRFGQAMIAVAILTGLVVAVFGLAAWNDVHDEIESRGALISNLAARSTRLFYRQFDAALSDLATEILDEGALDEPARAERLLRRAMASIQGMQALCLVDADGRLLTEVMAPGFVNDGPFQPDVVRARDSRLEVGLPVAVKPDGRWVVPMRLAASDPDGRTRFALVALTAVDDQWRLLSDLVLPSDWVMGLRRDDGRLQARWPRPQDPRGTFERPPVGPISQILAARPGMRSGSVTGPSPVDGLRRLFVFERVADYPFVLYVSIPTRAIAVAWLDRMRLAASLFVLLAIGGLWVHRHLTAQQAAHTAALALRQSRLALLHRIAVDVIDGVDADRVVRRALEELARRYPDLRASYATLDPRGAVHVLDCVAPIATDTLAGRHLARPCTADQWEQLRAGQPVAITRASAVADASGDPSSACGAGARLLAPVPLSESLLGLLVLDTPAARTWSPEEIETMGDVASQLAVVFRNAANEALRAAAVAELRLRETRFRDISEMTSDWFWEQDADLVFTTLTHGRDATLDLREPAIGRRRWEIEGILDLEEAKWEVHRQQLAQRQPFRNFVYRLESPDGPRWVAVSGKPLFEADGSFAGYRGSGRDITERRNAEERIRFLAQHDELTGLPNRGAFRLALEQAIARARRHQRRFAVMFIDLDRFKLVNDTLGHAAGDLVLCDLSGRLAACLRAVDLLARQSGDEFVVLVEDFRSESDLEEVARKLLAACSRPFVIDDREFALSASIGIATYPDRRRRRRHAAARRRQRDVRREGRRPRPVPVPRPAARSRRDRAARPRDGAAAGRRARRDARALPAEARDLDGAHRRRGGAAALGASRARHAHAGSSSSRSRKRPDSSHRSARGRSTRPARACGRGIAPG
jgi:diguanylate cyclase (GGDEF)-like protein/PAS domain S-box-containing protein